MTAPSRPGRSFISEAHGHDDYQLGCGFSATACTAECAPHATTAFTVEYEPLAIVEQRLSLMACFPGPDAHGEVKVNFWEAPTEISKCEPRLASEAIRHGVSWEVFVAKLAVIH